MNPSIVWEFADDTCEQDGIVLKYTVEDDVIHFAFGESYIEWNIIERDGITVLTDGTSEFVRRDDYAVAVEKSGHWGLDIIIGKWVSDNAEDEIIISYDGTCTLGGETLLWTDIMSSGGSDGTGISLFLKEDGNTKYVLTFASDDTQNNEIITISTSDGHGSFVNSECSYKKEAENLTNNEASSNDTTLSDAPDVLYIPYIGKWVCANGDYVVVHEDGSLTYNDTVYTAEFSEMMNGIGVTLEDATFLSDDRNTTYTGCTFIWGLENLGERIMLGLHNNALFSLESE